MVTRSVLEYARQRSIADATYTLPLLSGTGMQFARQYPDKQVSTSSQDTIALEVTIGLLVVLGQMLTFFIPALPAPNPRRGFDFSPGLLRCRWRRLSLQAARRFCGQA